MAKLTIEYGMTEQAAIPDREYYRAMTAPPLLKSWLIPGELSSLYTLVECKTLVSLEGLYTLLRLIRQCQNLPGEFWECGVYLGGTADFMALMMANRTDMEPKTLRLFDTFEGMPETSSEFDLHKQGDFSHDLWQYIEKSFGRYPFVSLHRGFIPDTFHGLENSRIAFLHCDLDIYKSIHDNLDFCYPRMVAGGAILFDDYGHTTCPGARRAVDEFFADKPEEVFVLNSGQAFVIKL